MSDVLPARGVLRHRDFAFFLGARFLSTAAIQVQNVAVGWLVYDITRDQLALGLVGLVTFLPAVLLALVAGHVADRYDRRRILLACYTATLLTATGLLAFAWAGSEQVWILFALVLVFGVTRAFAGPAIQALLPNLEPREELGNAIAWGASAWQTAAIIGPAVAGLLYIFGEVVVFASSVGIFLVTIGFAERSRHPAAGCIPVPGRILDHQAVPVRVGFEDVQVLLLEGEQFRAVILRYGLPLPHRLPDRCRRGGSRSTLPS